jgi:hypothetical protein
MSDVRRVKVYLATRNSTGIEGRVLLVDGRDRVTGEETPWGRFEYLPYGLLAEVGGSDWRMSHYFFDRAKAVRDYKALESARIELATKALAQVA